MNTYHAKAIIFVKQRVSQPVTIRVQARSVEAAREVIADRITAAYPGDGWHYTEEPALKN